MCHNRVPVCQPIRARRPEIPGVFNGRAVTEEDRNFGPNYLNATAIMPDRLAKFAFELNF